MIRTKFQKNQKQIVEEINKSGFDNSIISKLENPGYHVAQKHADAYDAYLKGLKNSK